MPPATKRDACCILYDVNTKKDFQDRAKTAILEISGRKWFSELNDMCKLILFNVKETKNKLGYPNIAKVDDVFNYNLKILDKYILSNTEDVKPAEANWLQGLLVGIETLLQDYGDLKGVITYQLIFITDLCTPLKEHDKIIVEKIINKLNKFEIYLYILGPKVKQSKILKSFDDIIEWKDNLDFYELTDNLEIARKIIQETDNSIMCDLNIGKHLFTYYKNWKGSQPANQLLTVGTILEFPLAISRLLKPVEIKIREEDDDVTWKWVDWEDSEITVDYDNVIGCITMHEKLIPITEEIKKSYKYSGPSYLKLIAVTKRTNVPEYYLGDESSIATVDHRDETQHNKIFTLIETLHKLDSVIIATRVVRSNCEPKFIVLIPKIDSKPICFLVNDLPSADDIRIECHEQKLKFNNVTVKYVNDFLDAIDINNLNEKNIQVPLSPLLMQDIRFNNVVFEALNIYLEKDLKKDMCDVDLINKLMIQEDNFEKVLEMIPERVIEDSNLSEENIKTDDECSDDESVHEFCF